MKSSAIAGGVAAALLLTGCGDAEDVVTSSPSSPSAVEVRGPIIATIENVDASREQTGYGLSVYKDEDTGAQMVLFADGSSVPAPTALIRDASGMRPVADRVLAATGTVDGVYGVHGISTENGEVTYSINAGDGDAIISGRYVLTQTVLPSNIGGIMCANQHVFDSATGEEVDWSASLNEAPDGDRLGGDDLYGCLTLGKSYAYVSVTFDEEVILGRINLTTGERERPVEVRNPYTGVVTQEFADAVEECTLNEDALTCQGEDWALTGLNASRVVDSTPSTVVLEVSGPEYGDDLIFVDRGQGQIVARLTSAALPAHDDFKYVGMLTNSVALVSLDLNRESGRDGQPATLVNLDEL